MRLLRAGWTILRTWLFKVICSEITLLEKSDHLWKSFIYDILKGIVKLMLNSFLDILSQPKNTKCSLCGNKKAPQHVLNNCNAMLYQGRYSWRQKYVLRIIIPFRRCYWRKGQRSSFWVYRGQQIKMLQLCRQWSQHARFVIQFKFRIVSHM